MRDSRKYPIRKNCQWSNPSLKWCNRRSRIYIPRIDSIYYNIKGKLRRWLWNGSQQIHRLGFFLKQILHPIEDARGNGRQGGTKNKQKLKQYGDPRSKIRPKHGRIISKETTEWMEKLGWTIYPRGPKESIQGNLSAIPGQTKSETPKFTRFDGIPNGQCSWLKWTR